MLATLIVGKASIITALSLAFGMSFANSQLSGLLLAQGGELNFAILAFPTSLFFIALAQHHFVAPLCRTRGICVCSTGHCRTKWTH
jgi:Kef-type K+ transport system membrane component KefB